MATTEYHIWRKLITEDQTLCNWKFSPVHKEQHRQLTEGFHGAWSEIYIRIHYCFTSYKSAYRQAAKWYPNSETMIKKCEESCACRIRDKHRKT